MNEQLTFTEQLMKTSDDICYNKHQGNEQSTTANKQVQKENDRAKIVKYFQEFSTGTLKEVANHLDKQLNQISGRFTELKADEIIEPDLFYGEKHTRNGCLVYRLKKGNQQ
jgi:hypothetical protein